MTVPSQESRSTRELILLAAVEEFVARGYEGVRMEQVARRAGCNKALVYRYYSSRENLFEEALRHQFRQRHELLDVLPQGELAPALQWWTHTTLKNPLFIKLMLREAMDYGGAQPVESEARVEYYQQQMALLKGLQEQGAVDSQLDPQMLFLALLAVVSLPALLPQLVGLVSGEAADSTRFEQRWSGFLAQLAQQLAPRRVP